jgi:AraC family carnitine catabolism transcriptional activator
MSPNARRIGLLVQPQFTNLGLALAIEPLSVGNWLSQRPIFSWKVLSVDGRPVKASNGMTIAVDGAISTEDDFSTVFVVASFESKKHAHNARVKNWLRRLARFGVELGGIETGSEVLAAAGLLDGHRVAVHWENFDGFQELYPDVQATKQLYTIEPGRLTCAGALAVMDMMLSWISHTISQELALDIGEQLLKDSIRPPSHGQATIIDGAGIASQPVRKAIEFMQETLDEPLPCGEIAERVGLSRRQLERHFQQQLGVSPLKHYVMLRLAKAHQLLQQTDLPVTEIAISSGFGSPEHFSRLYRKMFGRSPSADRLQAVDAPVLRLKGKRTPSRFESL